MNGRNARANGRQEHYNQCKRDSSGHVWEVTRTVATPSMCHVSLIRRESNGDDLSALCTDS
jgi:hypothetical protein